MYTTVYIKHVTNIEFVMVLIRFSKSFNLFENLPLMAFCIQNVQFSTVFIVRLSSHTCITASRAHAGRQQCPLVRVWIVELDGRQVAAAVVSSHHIQYVVYGTHT